MGATRRTAPTSPAVLAVPSGRPSARSLRRRVAVAVAVLLAPCLVACTLEEDDTAEPLGQAVAAERIVDALDADEGERDAAASTPGADAPGTGPHAFNELAADGVTPVAYDPCRPIPYVVRSDGAPAEGARLVQEAVAMVSAASGLTFVYEGETDEHPSGDAGREFYQYERYGDRIAPVLVAWSNVDEAPELGSEDGGESETLGYAYSDSTYATDDESDAAPLVYVTGEVVLDAPDLQYELDEGEGYDYVLGVLAHEFAHLVGLDHVDDPGELMYPMTADVTRFGPGDRQGLAILGQGRCYPD